MVSPRVKICGLTRPGDVEAAVEAGAWAVGFVLWPDSPRAVTIAQVRELTRLVPDHVVRVGVTVNPSVDEVRRWSADAGLTTVQLHGDESVEPFLDLGLHVVKAVTPRTDADVAAAVTLPPAVLTLVDAHDVVKRGGTGRRADWAHARALAEHRPVILAGGLTPDNVAEAVAEVMPWAVDVSSGVERAPGEKDQVRIRAFCDAVRGSH